MNNIILGADGVGCSGDDALSMSDKSTPPRVVSSDQLADQYHYHAPAAAAEVDTAPYYPPPHLVAACSNTSDDESITGRYCHIEHKYHIDPNVLGTGHHGSVRECIERTTGKRFAVKSIRKADPMVKPGGLAREIMLLQEMQHSSIVQLIDVFEDYDYVHLVTHLCQGGELFDKIVEKSSLDNGAPCFREGEAAKIIHQILGGISYMQERGIVHRDIKPENILFDTTQDDSTVKIIDFGLSRKHGGGSRTGEPPMTTVVGTPYYIAPEVLKRRYDKACDLWSVGVIAYILLCGYPPFNGTDTDKTHKSVLRGKYYFPAEDWNDVSQEAMDFIYRLLQVDPKRRMTVEQALEHPWMVNQLFVPSCLKSREQDTSMEAAPAPVAPSTPVAPPAPPVIEQQRQDKSSHHEVYCNELPRPRSWQTTPTRMITRKQHQACDSPPRRKVKLSMFHM